MLSQRGQNYALSTVMDGYMRPKNKYEKHSNPNGLVSFSNAENFSLDPTNLTYNEGPIGPLALRSAMANHINTTFHPYNDITEENMTFAAGVTALNEVCAVNLVDPGEGLVLGMPCYGSFCSDFVVTSGCELVYTPFKGVDQFSTGVATQYEKALLKAKRKGIRIKALVICNPHNPLGRCYTVNALKEFFILCEKWEIHLINDEVYALSIFRDNGTPFTSVLSINPTGLLDKNRIHVLYGLSKDFGAAGLRLGCLITHNTNPSHATRILGRFHSPSEISCSIATQILSDKTFTTAFLNESHTLLSQHYKLTTRILDSAKISYYKKGNAGFFLWIDLSPFLVIKKGEKGEEEDKWDAEKHLSSRLLDAGVEMSTGWAYHNEEPGWFRVVFSVEREVLVEGLRRIIETVKL